MFLGCNEPAQLTLMWSEMFLDDGIRRALEEIEDKSLVVDFLKKGVALTPAWTPTKCAVRIEEMTAIAMAADSALHYSAAWIYALALYFELDPMEVQLTQKQVEVAFALRKFYKRAASGDVSSPKPTAKTAAAAAAGGGDDADMKETDDEDEDDEPAPLDWEPQLEDLPNDLQQVLARHTAGTLVLDARALMEDLPVWANLKAKAETNNHKADASSRYDRTLRSTQQKVLGLQRCYAALHTYLHDEEGKSLGQQFWALLLQLEASLLTARKAASIPGAVPSSEPSLFSKEDLKVVTEVQQINNAGMHSTGVPPKAMFSQSFPPQKQPFPSTVALHRELSCLCPTTGKFKSRWKWGKSQSGQKGFRPWKGKSFKGGKAHSGQSKGGYGGRGRSFWPGPSGAPTVGPSHQGQCKRRRTSPGDLVSTATASLPREPTGRVQPPPSPRPGCGGPGPGPIAGPQVPQDSRESVSLDCSGSRTSTATAWLGGSSPPPCQNAPPCCTSSTQGARHTRRFSPRICKKSAGSKNKSSRKNKLCGKRVGGHPPPSQTAAQPAVVVQKRFPTGGKLDQGGDHPTVDLPPQTVGTRKARSKSGPSPKNFGGLRKKWSSQKSLCRRHKTSPTLVPHFKVGTHRGNKMEVHFGLQRNKSALSSAKISAGSPPANFSPTQKRGLGLQNRPKRCIFSHPRKRGTKALLKAQGGGSGLGVPSRPLWAKCYAPNFSGRNENLRKKVEKGRGPGLHLPGRHPDCRSNQKCPPKAPRFGGAGPAGLRIQNKRKKVNVGASPGCSSPGIRTKFSRRKSATCPPKNEKHPKRTWKVRRQKRNVKKTTFSHLGTNQGQSSCPALFKGLHRRSGGISGQNVPRNLGQQTCHFPRNKKRIEKSKGNIRLLVGPTLSPKSHPCPPFGLKRSRVGGAGPQFGGKSPRILEGEKRSSHKRERNGGRHKYGVLPCKKWRNGGIKRRQSSNILLLEQGGGQKKPLQQNAQTLLGLADEQKYHAPCKMGAIRPMLGGPPQQVVARQGGLLTGPPPVSMDTKFFLKKYRVKNRFIRLARQQKIKKVCKQMATLAGSRGKCAPDPPGQVGGGVICQPPLVHYPKISPKTSGVPPGPCFDGRPLLGFSHMVAPINKNESARDPLPENQPLSGDVLKLLGGKNATPSVAPPLPDLLRQILEGRKIQNKTIDDFLARNKSLKRYSSSFQMLWGVLERGGVYPPEATSDEIADAIIQIFKYSPAQARNAYSAVLLLPGVGGGCSFPPFTKSVQKAMEHKH
jgi:hypothetical protein